MKIPIKHAIESGAWFQCVSGWDFQHKEHSFRFRVLSFDRVNLEQIDHPENINLKIDGGILWIMKLQLINLNRTEEGITEGLIHIVDNEDYNFPIAHDDHLQCYSNYAEVSGLRDLFGKSYIPKIKYTGALLYLLPEEEAEYFVSVPGGNIKEI